jgi:hypothetical protein
MPGIKGMTAAAPRSLALRNKIWRSMRILRRFTIPDLCRTAGAKRTNVRKFVKRLEVHGYVAQLGGYVSGRAGVFRGLRLVKDVGPVYPMRCELCGRPLGSPCINEDKETIHEDNAAD